jgi:hypothetical protein
MQKFILIVVLFNLISFSSFSQQDSSKNSSTVILLGTDRTTEQTTYNSSAIKLGIFDIIAGMYGLNYEKELSSIFSIQAGAGLTGRNYTQGLLTSDESNDESSNQIEGGSDILDSYYNYENRSAKMGYFVTLQPKFYMGEDGFDGSFFSFMLSYRRYNYEAKNVDNTVSDIQYVIANPISEYENQLITALSYGHQNTNDKTVVEWDFQVGVRGIKGERRDLWSVTDNSGNAYTYAYKNKVSKTGLYVGLSLKIGLYWSNSKK